MPLDANAENFDELTASGAVVLDFWGPACQPCLALLPTVEALEAEHAGQLEVVKVDASGNRQICRQLEVLGLPTFVFLRDGKEVERLSGATVSVDDLRRSFSSLVGAGV